jgi:pyrroloquinoline quinone biosynthesis protein B
VQIILLGTAAGGGFPQWNCWCPGCRVARADPTRAHPRTQSSIAVSTDGQRWILVNASPDVREQITRIPRAEPAGDVMRDVPIEGVVLTDAELDHSLGLLLLREGRALTVYATQSVLDVLERDSRILPTARAFASLSLVALPLDREVAVVDREGVEMALTLEAFAVDGDPPRFAGTTGLGHTAGMMLRDKSGAAAAYVPGCGGFTASLIERLATAHNVLFDGTFWSDDELIKLGISSSRAREMGHLPISGPDGSLAVLHRLSSRPTVIYTHMNNTNPILIEDSPERRTVEAAGVFVGSDGEILRAGSRGPGSGVRVQTTARGERSGT